MSRDFRRDYWYPNSWATIVVYDAILGKLTHPPTSCSAPNSVAVTFQLESCEIVGPSGMSLITPENRLTVKKFAAVPSVLGLTPIVQPGSVSTSSSRRAVGGFVDIDEGCMLTKSVKYTHQLAHWVSAVQGGDSSAVVSTKFI